MGESLIQKENSDEADCHPSLIVVRSELILTHDAILASYLSLDIHIQVFILESLISLWKVSYLFSDWNLNCKLFPLRRYPGHSD